MCTGNIVVSLPALKALIVRSSPSNTDYVHNDIYINTSSGKPQLSAHGTSRSHVQAGRLSDDELELVFQGSRKPSPSPSRTTSSANGERDAGDAKGDVVVTMDWKVESHAV